MKTLKFSLLIVLLIIFGVFVGIGIRFLQIDKLIFSPESVINTGNLNEFSTNNFSASDIGNFDKKATGQAEEQKETSKINLIFVGDIMLDRGVRNKVETIGKGDYLFPFLKVVNFLKTADVVFGNLEGPISDKGKDVGNLYSFRMSPQAVAGLKGAGFKVLFLANNHIGDWGLEALKDTVSNLEKNSILTVGVEIDSEKVYKARIFELKDLKLALLGFADFEDQYRNTEVENNIAIADPVRVSEAIKEAREKADIVIVYYHFGEEYEKEPNPRQKFLAELAIDEGADLVVGSHPHVIQPLEIYKDKYIAYSLGNFVFDQNFSEETMVGALLKVVVEDKRIVSADLKEFRINSDFQPVIE